MKFERFERLKQDSIGHLLIKAARIYNNFAFNEVKFKLQIRNLKPSHLQLFPHIPFDGITVVELANKLNISKQAVSKLVNELFEEGILVKTENPNDLRSFLITFNKEGKSTIFNGMQELVKLDQEIIKVIGKNRSTELKKILASIINNFE